MKWYIAKFVFRIICGGGNHKSQFDEQLRLITAEDAEEAFYKAKDLGMNEQESFYNDTKQLVQWQFVNVADLKLVDSINDGSELYSKIEEIDDAEQYILIVNRRSENIISQFTTCISQES